MADGTMGGSPRKQGGSMLPPNFVEEKAREKELSALDDASSKQSRVEEDKEEQVEDERKKKIDDLLPETVVTAYGELSYDDFKKVYADVYEGVKQKEHWATGFVSHDTVLPGGTKITIRNFRRSEGDAIRALTPRSSVMGGGDTGTFFKENSLFVAVRVIIALMSFDGREQTPLPSLTIDNTEEWLKKEAVVKGIAWLDGLPDQIVTFMDAVVNDVLGAYNAAATENLKNQLAPLLDSTA
jgi:hypothetical protein